MPTLRGRPGQPEFSMWRTRTWPCSRASASRRSPVPSVEPSSTKISSCSSRASVWPSSVCRHSSMSDPGLNTGTMTLTFTVRQPSMAAHAARSPRAPDRAPRARRRAASGRRAHGGACRHRGRRVRAARRGGELPAGPRGPRGRDRRRRARAAGARAVTTSVRTGYPEHLREQVEGYLADLRFSEEPATRGLEEAMRYSLLAGGKRIRPVLALATAEAVGMVESVLPLAAALELIHTYSLIHDDLPAMDDDELRRGRPTCHVKYGEDVAILAGDGLYAEAFRLVLREQPSEPEHLLAAVCELAAATGVTGMVGGQYIDVRDLVAGGATS